MNERILSNESNGLCTLTLNRPEKLNALDTEAFESLDKHLAELEKRTDRVGCVVLRGEGRGFCAGADISGIGNSPLPPTFKPGVIERLANLTQPVIAAVHGVCYTGGLELALACDLIVADTTARFADTHGKWGLVAAWGMSQRLPRRIGVANAKRLMMTGKPVNVNEARTMGLVDLLTPEGQLEERIAELTDDILANSWHTNFAVKRLMRESDGMSLTLGLEYEREHYPGYAPDFRQRIERFTRR